MEYLRGSQIEGGILATFNLASPSRILSRPPHFPESIPWHTSLTHTHTHTHTHTRTPHAYTLTCHPSMSQKKRCTLTSCCAVCLHVDQQSQRQSGCSILSNSQRGNVYILCNHTMSLLFGSKSLGLHSKSLTCTRKGRIWNINHGKKLGNNTTIGCKSPVC